MKYNTKYYLEIYTSFEEMEKETAWKNGLVDDYDKIAEVINELIYERPRDTSNKNANEDIINTLILADPIPWYEYEEDLNYLSMMFPEYFFLLIGYGEDSDDMWRAYAHDGKYYHAPMILTYNPPKKRTLYSRKKRGFCTPSLLL